MHISALSRIKRHRVNIRGTPRVGTRHRYNSTYPDDGHDQNDEQVRHCWKLNVVRVFIELGNKLHLYHSVYL